MTTFIYVFKFLFHNIVAFYITSLTLSWWLFAGKCSVETYQYRIFENKATSVTLVELPPVAVSRMSSCSQDKRLEVQLQAISKPAVSSLECFCFFFLGHVSVGGAKRKKLGYRRISDSPFDLDDWNWKLILINSRFRVEIVTHLLKRHLTCFALACTF